MPMAAYTTSATQMFWGDESEAAEFTADRQSLGLQPNNVIPRFSRQTAVGRVGMTADAVSLGYSGSANVYASEATELFRSIREGILFISRSDAVKCIAIPMPVTAVSAASTATGAGLLTLGFGMREGGAVVGARVPGPGTLTVPTDGVGYYWDSSEQHLVRVTANATLTAGDIGVAGMPLVARNALL